MTARFDRQPPNPLEFTTDRATRTRTPDRDLERALTEEAMTAYMYVVHERMQLGNLVIKQIEPNLPPPLRARLEELNTKLAVAISELWPKMKALQQLSRRPLPPSSPRKQ